ncbi:MAG: response regulator [Leptospiraceae bacterium]|nr:response regulator [Leptospiraceae bacterium]
MGKKIVIIDDELHIRMLMEQTLEDFEDEDVEIFTAANGAEGLELIIEEKPDLVICDVMMPKMNGFEVCEKVKSDPELKHIYFILLTAKGQEADKQKGASMGADMYMTKPFDPDMVLQKVGALLGIDA